ncbi:hypothetical protein PF004_g9589 [Phytophthora fragariae]|uniref:Uncharacterized protein n=1 Tax=Phytophthora fragariae TaxID=53985 RepID=A0A6G0P3G4_9STRA|nr:hypothetical protein PF004_g9589 [Phytophthora fragariae]
MTKAAKTKTKGKNFTKSEVTRNGTCPEEVQRAKRLQYAIEASLAVVQLHDNFSDEEFEEGDPDHGTMNADVEAANPVPMTASSPISRPTDSQLTQTPPATLSRPTAPSTPLQATPRAGLEPSELAELSASLGKHRIINAVNNDIQASQKSSDPSQSMMAMLIAMEERQQARDAQYRHDRELYQRQRDERDSANQQMMMMLLVRLVGSGGGAASGGEQHGNDAQAGLENKVE